MASALCIRGVAEYKARASPTSKAIAKIYSVQNPSFTPGPGPAGGVVGQDSKGLLNLRLREGASRELYGLGSL